ncbi:MAG: TlpA family protein disulfide reductase [Rhodocyclaceae bacterium]|nr:TlpA family protein disulfide reductase [Rhodocyclaceae bacterium]
MKQRWFLIIAVATGAAALGFYVGKPKIESPSPATQATPEAQDAAQKLANLSIFTAQGQPVSLRQWQGKVLVVNFWATWCPPCREEMPEFSRVHEQLNAKGVQFVGIGIDTPDNIINFEKAHPVSYPLLMGTYETLKLTAELGNTSSALPFTVILDREGKVAHTKMGKLSEAELNRLLVPLYSATSPKQ